MLLLLSKIKKFNINNFIFIEKFLHIHYQLNEYPVLLVKDFSKILLLMIENVYN